MDDPVNFSDHAHTHLLSSIGIKLQLNQMHSLTGPTTYTEVNYVRQEKKWKIWREFVD